MRDQAAFDEFIQGQPSREEVGRIAEELLQLPELETSALVDRAQTILNWCEKNGCERKAFDLALRLYKQQIGSCPPEVDPRVMVKYRVALKGEIAHPIDVTAHPELLQQAVRLLAYSHWGARGWRTGHLGPADQWMALARMVRWDGEAPAWDVRSSLFDPFYRNEGRDPNMFTAFVRVLKEGNQVFDELGLDERQRSIVDVHLFFARNRARACYGLIIADDNHWLGERVELYAEFCSGDTSAVMMWSGYALHSPMAVRHDRSLREHVRYWDHHPPGFADGVIPALEEMLKRPEGGFQTPIFTADLWVYLARYLSAGDQASLMRCCRGLRSALRGMPLLASRRPLASAVLKAGQLDSLFPAWRSVDWLDNKTYVRSDLHGREAVLMQSSAAGRWQLLEWVLHSDWSRVRDFSANERKGEVIRALAEAIPDVMYWEQGVATRVAAADPNTLFDFLWCLRLPDQQTSVLRLLLKIERLRPELARRYLTRYAELKGWPQEVIESDEWVAYWSDLLRNRPNNFRILNERIGWERLSEHLDSDTFLNLCKSHRESVIAVIDDYLHSRWADPDKLDQLFPVEMLEVARDLLTPQQRAKWLDAD